MRALAILFLALAAGAQSAEVQVLILQNRFDPEVVSILPGDTVTWTVERGSHQLGAVDQAAYPGLQSAPLGRGESFSFTFDSTPGEVFYISEAVEGMQGAVLIQDPAPPFIIDERVSSGWYDPAAPGQGVLFEYVPSSNVLVAYWFTFGFQGDRQLWLIGSGTPQGNRATLEMLEPQGGRINDPQTVTKPSWGEMTVEFSDCNQATVYFNGAGDQKSGRVSLQRLYLASLCQ